MGQFQLNLRLPRSISPRLRSSDQAMSVQISNELGQLIKTISITDTQKEVKINHLSSGVYFITGENSNGSVKQKLIITE